MASENNSSYLNYLPAVFHRRPDAPEQLPMGQYLVPFETEMAQFNQLLESLDRYFSPELAPDADFLPWLATWVALTLDEEWDQDKQRQLIAEAIELYRWRGTVRGMKRYLDLYVGLPEEEIEIEEGRWPAGMQIGVSSQIGGFEPENNGRDGPPTRLQVLEQEYYVVETAMPTDFPPEVETPDLADGQRLRILYPMNDVERVDLEETGVRVWYRRPDANSTIVLVHQRPEPQLPDRPFRPNMEHFGRRISYRYPKFVSDGDEVVSNGMYVGSSFLVQEIRSPYRFIVTVRESKVQISPNDARDRRFEKIRSVLDTEKPAHTDYYLKTQPIGDVAVPVWMQIDVRSTIGLDTFVG